MHLPPAPDLPLLADLDGIDQDRAADMLDNRPCYGARRPLTLFPRVARGRPMTEIQIHAFRPEAECEYSGKTGEAVEISTADGSIRHAVISIPELTKLLRFRHRQQGKQHREPPAGGSPDRAAG